MQAATKLQVVDWHRKSLDLDTRNQKELRYKVTTVLLLLAALLHRLALLEAMSHIYKEEMMFRMKSDQQSENWKI